MQHPFGKGSWGELGTAGLRNVVRRLLGARGPDMPNNMARELQIIFDMTRRDPELLLELGIVPWFSTGTVAAVAAQNSFLEIRNVSTGYIQVIVQIIGEAAGSSMSLFNTATLGGTQRPIYSNDLRYGGPNGVNPLSTVVAPAPFDGTTAAALPTTRLWKRGNIFTLDQPVVLGEPQKYPLQGVDLTVNTVNIGLDWNFAGYSLRVQPP